MKNAIYETAQHMLISVLEMFHKLSRLFFTTTLKSKYYYCPILQRKTLKIKGLSKLPKITN